MKIINKADHNRDVRKKSRSVSSFGSIQSDVKTRGVEVLQRLVKSTNLRSRRLCQSPTAQCAQNLLFCRCYCCHRHLLSHFLFWHKSGFAIYEDGFSRHSFLTEKVTNFLFTLKVYIFNGISIQIIYYFGVSEKGSSNQSHAEES